VVAQAAVVAVARRLAKLMLPATYSDAIESSSHLLESKDVSMASVKRVVFTRRHASFLQGGEVVLGDLPPTDW
jgi:hypothetical protein